MTPKIKKVYNSGLNNKKFLQEIAEADGDEKPNILSSDIDKHFFVSMYYGWLVGKHGADWELYL